MAHSDTAGFNQLELAAGVWVNRLNYGAPAGLLQVTSSLSKKVFHNNGANHRRRLSGSVPLPPTSNPPPVENCLKLFEAVKNVVSRAEEEVVCRSELRAGPYL